MVFWLAFVWAALKLLSMPDTGRHSHLGGWMILVVATALMIGAVDRWVRYLPVIFGGGLVGSLLATASGHLLNQRPIPRWVPACISVLFVGSGLVSQTFQNRKLTKFDRGTLVVFAAMFAAGAAVDDPTILIWWSLAFACLLVMWLRNRLLTGRQ